MRILLIEDDTLIGEGLKAGLEKQSFSVDLFMDGLLGRDALAAADYDAVVLDLSLPGMDGLEILSDWRRQGRDTPVLILTARGTIDQRVEGLNLGADDYLGKPFALEELVARLRALIRRRHGKSFPTLNHGSVSYHPDNQCVLKDGQDVEMSPKEVMLVELFMLNKENILSKSVIEEKIYPWGMEVSSNAVEVYIHRIRRKLGNQFIKTVYGIGYSLGDAS